MYLTATYNVRGQAEQKKLSSVQCGEFYITEVLPVAAVHNGEGLIDFGFYSSG